MRTYKKLWWPRFRPFFWIFDELKPTWRGPRGASNYGLWIVVRKTSPEWQIQQEIYESRYWLCHPWRLVDFLWFYKGKPRVVTYIDGIPTKKTRASRWYKAAAHLARVECASRAQEIRAKYDHLADSDPEWWLHADDEMWSQEEARDYARSIHGAKSYPFIRAAGWTEEDCYNEIVKRL